MSLNVIERHLCEIAALVIPDIVLLNIFLSQVDWIFEKANIAVMDENSGVFLMFQVHLFDAPKV